MESYIDRFRPGVTREPFNVLNHDNKLIHLVNEVVVLHYLDMAYEGLDVWGGFSEYKEKLKKEFTVFRIQDTKLKRSITKTSDFYDFGYNFLNIILSDEQYHLKNKKFISLFNGTDKIEAFTQAFFNDDTGYASCYEFTQFVKIFLTHCIASAGFEKAQDIEFEEAAIMLPWVLTSTEPSFSLIKCKYKFNKKVNDVIDENKEYQAHIPSFIEFLMSVTLSDSDNTIDSFIYILSSFLIDSRYSLQLIDSAYTHNVTKPVIRSLYRVCFKAVSDDYYNGKLFQYINRNELKGTVKNCSADGSRARNLCLKTLIGLSENRTVHDGALIKKLILATHDNISRMSMVDDIMKIIYRFPEINVESVKVLKERALTDFAKAFAKKFYSEADELDEKPDEESSGNKDEDDKKTEEDDFDFGGSDDFNLDDLDGGGTGDKKSDGGKGFEGFGSDDEPEVDSVKTLFDISGNTEFTDILYRLEVDRRIAKILKMQSFIPELSSEDLKFLKRLRSSWLYLVNKNVLDILLDKFRRRQLI